MAIAGTGSTRIHKYLHDTELFSDEQIDELLAVQRESGAPLAEIVVAQGYADEQVFVEALAKSMNLPYLRIGNDPIEGDILNAIPTKAVFQYKAIPVAQEGNTLRIATHDPFRAGLNDALRLVSGKRIRLALSPLSDIEKAAKKFYGVGGETIERMMASDDRIDIDMDLEGLDKSNLDEQDEDATIVKFVNQIIWEAHQSRATDIHFEPMEQDLRIRYRIDGVLHNTPVPAQLKRFQAAILSRIKVMANMDIAEKRLPQDGRISVKIQGEEIDIRVSTMPTVYGESISLRLLMRGAAMLGLDSLGLDERDEKVTRKLVHKPHGIILVTGPTGSGKSTSLYAYLHTINSIDKRLITVEDPIEYEMAGVNQIQMKPEIGLTFAVGLRHILRQDPDVIMVGEIRDKETAEIAIQAALTGHLVFSTLHTNDAAGGISRLLDMGVEPFLVSSSIEALIAQRLVRRLCPECRKPYQPNEVFLDEIAFPKERLHEGTIYEPNGCESCRGSGYQGRTAIYEVLPMSDSIRSLVTQHASASVIKNQGLKEGMRTLREDGWNKVLKGITTLEEVIRVTEEDEFDDA